MDSLPLRLTLLHPDAPGDAGRSVLRWVAANPAWLANGNAVGRPPPSNFLRLFCGVVKIVLSYPCLFRANGIKYDCPHDGLTGSTGSVGMGC